MTGLEVGIASVVLIVILIYAGPVYPGRARAGVVRRRVDYAGRDLDVPINLLSLAVADTVSHYVFATVPLFALMGFLVSKAGLGPRHLRRRQCEFSIGIKGGPRHRDGSRQRDLCLRHGLQHRLRVGLYARISVPEMRRYGYGKRVLGRGWLRAPRCSGCLIPPSAMLIIYAIVCRAVCRTSCSLPA